MAILHGQAAVRAVEQLEGITLDYCETRIVLLEGYSTVPYRDTKLIWTNRVGQTGPWLNAPFRDAFQHHVRLAVKRVPGLMAQPEYLRAELIQAAYRGDLALSPKACGYMRDERWAAAAEEFLDHAEYKNPSTPLGIRKRIAAVSHALYLRSVQ